MIRMLEWLVSIHASPSHRVTTVQHHRRPNGESTAGAWAVAREYSRARALGGSCPKYLLQASDIDVASAQNGEDALARDRELSC